jgi:alkanesulfonate monooxygenase SsuD/methylene tetrahydromethanopterin reductase-like flavin-dependent oxidoreductase (luciferase family)
LAPSPPTRRAEVVLCWIHGRPAKRNQRNFANGQARAAARHPPTSPCRCCSPASAEEAVRRVGRSAPDATRCGGERLCIDGAGVDDDFGGVLANDGVEDCASTCYRASRRAALSRLPRALQRAAPPRERRESPSATVGASPRALCQQLAARALEHSPVTTAAATYGTKRKMKTTDVTSE